MNDRGRWATPGLKSWNFSGCFWSGTGVGRCGLGWKWCRSGLGVKAGTSRLGIILKLFPSLVCPALCWREKHPHHIVSGSHNEFASENQTLFWFDRVLSYAFSYLIFEVASCHRDPMCPPISGGPPSWHSARDHFSAPWHPGGCGSNSGQWSEGRVTCALPLPGLVPKMSLISLSLLSVYPQGRTSLRGLEALGGPWSHCTRGSKPVRL